LEDRSRKGGGDEGKRGSSMEKLKVFPFEIRGEENRSQGA